MSKQPSIVRRDSGEELNILGTTLRFICSGEATGKAWSMMESVVPLNAGPPPHQHDWDEAFYVMSGAIDVTIDGATTRVGAGDFVYSPAGTAHGFKGASETPARMLVFDVPAHAETFFKALHREVRTIPDDLHKMPALATEHGIRFLPPAAE